MLARAGVPGLVLWLVTAATWFAMLLSRVMAARRNGDADWANLFVWIACYGLSILINASFDVALEGPMLGIWFWCIIGFGIAASMIYRASCDIPAGRAAGGLSPAAPQPGLSRRQTSPPTRARR